MGKYDRIFNSDETSTESLSPEEGVAAIAIISVLSDSEEFDVGTDYLIDLLWETELFDDYSDDEMAEMIDRLGARSMNLCSGREPHTPACFRIF